jgi:hypothetical protein
LDHLIASRKFGLVIGCAKAPVIHGKVELPCPEAGLDILTGRREGSPIPMAHPYAFKVSVECLHSRPGAESQTAGTVVENRVSSWQEATNIQAD